MARKSYDREPFTSLTAVTATATGDEVGFVPRGYRGFPEKYSWDVKVTGAPSAVSVVLEGNIGDPDVAADWFVVDTSTITTSELRHVTDKIVRYLRAKLNTLTGGTAW